MLDQDYNVKLLNQPMDIQKEFAKYENTYYLADSIADFSGKKQNGHVCCKRYIRKNRLSFNDGRLPFEEGSSWEFPPHYEENKKVYIQVDQVSEAVVRLRLKGNDNKDFTEKDHSIMLTDEIVAKNTWEIKEEKERVMYRFEKGTLEIVYHPFHIVLKDTEGKILLESYHMSDSFSLLNCDPIPFAMVETLQNMKIHWAASFHLFPDEKIFGTGESFTALNKRGQKLLLYTKDPHGVQTPNMYKPIPFYLSSRGYGIFFHTSTPISLDLGCTYDSAQVSYIGDDMLELFFIVGSPKEILKEYTKLTGRASMVPEWSFGLWMSRISYHSQQQVEDVVNKMKEERIPCKVVHLDTGWFEDDWKCDFEFSKTRFPNVEEMFRMVEKNNIHISLWQYPYFTPLNPLFQEIVRKGFCVQGLDGGLPTKDAVLDFSNPEGVAWYQNKLKNLLELGTDCIKADFGEAAPIDGIYQSGKSGFYEHNLYPLRYNQAVSEIMKKVKGHSIIWARSAWAGSQRFPVHWGGDSENTLSDMKSTLRGALSLGLCGFTFYSHDIGGFVKRPSEFLYRRWLAFGVFTSHMRCHGAPPREPWEYGDDFLQYFREIMELREELMPYILEQAEISCKNGFPMMRTLFFEEPEDPGAWLIDDEYFFGDQLLVAPLFDEKEGREVYLPQGLFQNYFTKKQYQGGKWYYMESEKFPIIVLKRI